MTSFKAKTILWLMRNRHLFRGKLQKESFDMNTSITEFRDTCEKGAAMFGKLPDGITVRKETIEDIPSEWIIPPYSNPEKLILYVHGGGYVSGSCNDHRSIVAGIAANSGITCLHFEYRLAPEHPYPAALDDSLKIYSFLSRKGYNYSNILVMGESAGGGLALALLLAIKEKKLVQPAAAVAISPWTDLACTGESYKTKNRRSLAPANSWTVFSNHYTAGKNPTDPLISPLYGEPKGLPPILINSGSDDELFDDGKRFAEKALKAGVDITFREGKDMIHCYPLLAPMFPEASLAMDEILDFIKLHLA